MNNHKASLKSTIGNSSTGTNDGNNGNSALLPLIVAFFKSSTEIVEQFRKQFQLFNKKLTNIAATLDKFFECNLMKMVKNKISELKIKTKNELEKKTPPDSKIIDEMQKELQRTLNDEKIALKHQNMVKKDPYFEEKIQKLEHAQNILALDDGMQVETFDKIQNDATKTRACSELFKTTNGEFRTVEEFERNIGKVLIERVSKMEQSIIDMSQRLPSESHVALDMSQWQIQSLIRDVKLHFHKMISTEFEVGHDLQRCIDKLDESMAILIGVYDRIDSYSERTELATYFADIASIQFQNGVMKNDAICDLSRIIKTNFILEQYEIVLNAFKQHKFPFAHIYMQEFELPERLCINDIDGLKQEVIGKINKMHESIDYSNITIGKYDKDIVFVKQLVFYMWKNEEIRDDIYKLLHGEEIVIKADIAKGLNQNAVKFKDIGIHLKIANERLQNELDSKLENFHVIMNMIGNTYYRCGKRSYRMSVDENIVIEYSIKKEQNGKPIGKNNVYSKIRKSDFFLSPYTMWSIRLSNGVFGDLDKFKNEIIDLQLIGTGQYVKHSSSFTNEFPSHVLDKHYDFDSIISYANENKLIDNL